MLSLQPLESLGYTLAFFKFPARENEETPFTYYTFDNVPPPHFALAWNLIGFRQRDAELPLIDIQLLHIGDDERVLRAFNPFFHTANFLNIHPYELVAFIQFLEEKLGYPVEESAKPPVYFARMHANDLAAIHLSPWLIKQEQGDYYHYLASKQIQSSDYMSIMRFPLWSSAEGSDQMRTLSFVTFMRQKLLNPTFHPFDGEWLGTMSFSQPTLEEFIRLLKQWTYKAHRDI